MRVFPDQNQKVVVSRGYLTGISALSVSLAGMLVAESDYLSVWVGIAFIAIGVGLQIRSLPHLMTPPQPLDQDRREEQGLGAAPARSSPATPSFIPPKGTQL